MAADPGSRALLARPAFIVSAVVLVLVVLAGVGVFLRGDPPSASPPAPATPPSSPPAAAGNCRPTDTAQTLPTAPPAGVTWQLFGPFALPISKSAGPLVLDGGIARCFARTPLGAALAAQHLSTRMHAGPDSVRATTQQATPGPGRDKWINKLMTEGAIDLTDPTGTVQVGGFRVVSFTTQQAVVELTPNEEAPGQVRVYTYALVWDGTAWGRGDWKLAIRPDGELSPPPHQLPSSDGATPDGAGFLRWRTA